MFFFTSLTIGGKGGTSLHVVVHGSSMLGSSAIVRLFTGPVNCGLGRGTDIPCGCHSSGHTWAHVHGGLVRHLWAHLNSRSPGTN